VPTCALFSGVNMFAMLTGNLPFTVQPFTIKALYAKMIAGDMNTLPDYLSNSTSLAQPPHFAVLSSDVFMEDKLFSNVLNNDHHVLFYISPDHNNRKYNLRPSRHEITLAIKDDARNFFKRQLFKDTY